MHNRKLMSQMSRTFSQKYSFSGEGKSDLPKYNPMEFEPFKYNYEKVQVIPGFTQREQFGIFIGKNYSNTIKKEMRKDKIAFVFIILMTIVISGLRKQSIDNYEGGVHKYLTHERRRNHRLGEGQGY